MWLKLASKNDLSASELVLREISTKAHWETYRKLRAEIEIPFGITDSTEVNQFIDEIQQVTSKFPSSWYLGLNSENQIVGSIGLVEFEFGQMQVGRLLDIDIVPSFQGRGYGNHLIWAIARMAHTKGLSYLCLKTDAHRWVKDWYQKLGFEVVGYWNP